MTSESCGCGQPRRERQRDCLDCHARSMRRHRATHPLTARQRLVRNSRSYTRVYRQRGLLPVRPCETCGAAAETHHDDYDRPLEVRWLCRPHHHAWHRLHGPGRLSRHPGL